MHQTKTLSLLRKLDQRRLRSLDDFLASPYHNRREDNVLFFRQLCQFAPTYDQPELEKKRFLQSQANAWGWNAKDLTYRLSELAECIVQFLLWEDFVADEWAHSLARLRLGRRLELDTLVKQAERRLDQLAERQPYRDAHYYEQAYQRARLDYLADDPYQRNYRPRLQSAASALDRWYLHEKLRYGWEMANLEAMLDLHYDHGPEPALIDWLDGQADFSDSLLLMFRLALTITRELDRTDAYYELKDLLERRRTELPPDLRKAWYTGLLNFCLRRGNRDTDKVFMREYLDLSLMLLEEEVADDGRLSPWRYTNLVTSGLRCGETRWVWNFLHQYRDRLPEDRAENLYLFGLGQYYYHQRQWADAQRTLAQVSFDNVAFNLSLRALLARLYYEADETEMLFAQLEANRLFILRDQSLDPARKLQMRNFTDYLRRLARLDPPDPDALQTLLHNLPPAEQILHHEWLRAQLEAKLKTFLR